MAGAIYSDQLISAAEKGDVETVNPEVTITIPRSVLGGIPLLIMVQR